MQKKAMAAFRPQPTSEKVFGSEPFGRVCVAVRRLLALPLALALIAPGATALAAESTTGYGQTSSTTTVTTTTGTTTGYSQTPTAPKTETTKTTPTKTTAKQEVAPTKTSTTNATTPTTTTPAVAPTTTTTPHVTTLPFTGLDLRWVIVAGVFLIGAGLSILFVQRGRHGTGQ